MISIRSALLSDAEFLFNLRNLPENRTHFGNSGTVDWPEHLDWLKRALQDDKIKIYIAQLGEKPSGQFRMAADGEVSVSLAEGVKGRGIGTELIRLASNECRKVHSGRLVAYIKTENFQSQKAFSNAGYVYDCEVIRNGAKFKKYFYGEDKT